MILATLVALSEKLPLLSVSASGESMSHEHLAEGAGHIGFGVAKPYRNQGYASKGLRFMVDIAKTIIPEDEIYMACYKYNQASLKAQLANGAYIHHEDEEEYFTRIKC